MTAGKITLFAVLSGAILSATTLAAYFQVLVPLARASTVSTTVTVLNTPPQWDNTGHAHEDIESSTSTPTDVGARIYFDASATDSGNDAYFLIICTAGSVAPTPHDNAPPTCAGGNNNQIAISATTTSGTTAQAATTTIDNTTWAPEKWDWTGWICDAHVPGAACNPQMYNGDESNYPNRSSPFIVNHPPQFTAVFNNSPKDPGQSITWTTTATDTDTIRGTEAIQLWVCKTASFSTSTGCGAGYWATATSSAINPTVSYSIPIPTQDGPYNAFIYLEDANFSAATTSQGASSSYSVNNVAPSVSPATISLINYDGSTTLSLLNPAASTSNYKVQFTVTDNNSCVNQASSNEITAATTSVYRSSLNNAGRIGYAGCQSSSDFDSNKCYPSNGGGYTNFICTQDTTPGNCNGATDATVTWTCTFSLWFNADPTDSGSQFPTDTWLAGVQVTDDNAANSVAATSSTGAALDSFLAFAVSTTTIGYGGLQPGQSNSPIVQTTDLNEQGNIGLDENLYGDTMCTNWTSPDSCDTKHPVPSATSTIPVTNQHFGLSSVAYGAGTALTSSTSPSSVAIHVLKTTATTSIQTKNTFWGIAVPAAVTLSGSYTGQNTITAVRSNSSFW